MKTCLPPSVRLSDPASLIIALPHLIGFYPRDSLVVVALHGDPPKIGQTIRVDLPPAGVECEIAEALSAPLLAHCPVAVLLVVIGGCPHPLFGAPGRPLVNAMSDLLARHDVPIVLVLWAESLAADARWSCFDGCCAGRLPDPAASLVATATTAAGWVTFSDRAELARLVAADDDEVLDRRGAMLDAAVDGLDAEQAAVGSAEWVRRNFALVTAAVEAAGRGELPSEDEQLVRLAVALSDHRVRDRCFGFCTSDRASAAEQLWLALTRATPAPEVANPAMLAGFCAYLRGNGALAGEALDRALQAWPEHNMATLLQQALASGLAPELLARIAEDAAADAELTTVDDDDTEDECR